MSEENKANRKKLKAEIRDKEGGSNWEKKQMEAVVVVELTELKSNAEVRVISGWGENLSQEACLAECFCERKPIKLTRNTQEMGESDSSALLYCSVR